MLKVSKSKLRLVPTWEHTVRILSAKLGYITVKILNFRIDESNLAVKVVFVGFCMLVPQ